MPVSMWTRRRRPPRRRAARREAVRGHPQRLRAPRPAAPRVAGRGPGTAPTTPPVVYSGAVHLDELRALAREWCVSAVLAKPFSPARLVAAVREAIEAGEKP